MRSLASIVLVAWMAGASAAVQAHPLASGSLPEVSFTRVGAALIVCIAATIAAAAVLLRNRMALGKSIGRNGLFGQAVRTRRLSAVEVLRIAPQTELTLIRCDETEYLILTNSGGVSVLSRHTYGAVDGEPA
ncbi:MAG TPA: hypothetical protein VJM34_11140 [Novosphingobium sp.]|nr:hypothetical protein [Novosphingobium sp.]